MNIQGEVDRYDSKWTIFISAGLGLLSYIIMNIAAQYDPKKRITEMEGKFESLTFWLTLFISMLGLFFVYNASIHSSGRNIFEYIHILLGILFIFLGNYMFNMRPNYFIGVRTPWTLENEDIWKRTHQFAGKLFFISGIAIILICLLPIEKVLRNKISLGLMLVSAFIPVLYSYIIYRNTNQ